MKKVYIVGTGLGSMDYLHKKAIDLVESSDCLIGAKRMIESFSHLKKESYISINSIEIVNYIKTSSYACYSVLVSGDSGFYSMSKKLTEMILEEKDIEIENIPAISSLQYFCSKLNLPWDNIHFISAHGRNTNIISNIMFNKKTFLLTGGDLRPENICKILTDKGLGNLKISVGENLSYENEKVIEDSAENILHMKFDSLCVMIIHNNEALDYSQSLNSIKDEEFITGKVPMTKREVRSISISKLNLKRNSVIYDIGAGTGSVSIETALKLNDGLLYAIEKNKEAVNLIKQNIKKFKAFNIEVLEDIAPNGIENLPKPDSAFIGGSSGNLDEIINVLLKKNPEVNIVINTITLQSLNEALNCIEKYKLKDTEIINISVSKSKKVGSYNMMMGQNPIYVISGKGSGNN